MTDTKPTVKSLVLTELDEFYKNGQYGDYLDLAVDANEKKILTIEDHDTEQYQTMILELASEQGDTETANKMVRFYEKILGGEVPFDLKLNVCVERTREFANNFDTVEECKAANTANRTIEMFEKLLRDSVK
jgi:hypothetical protein